MKKWLAALLCVALLLIVFAGSLAEQTNRIQLNEKSDAFDVFIVLPEGAEIADSFEMGEGSSLKIRKDNLAVVTVSVAPSELYAGLNLADLNEDALEELKRICGLQYASPVLSVEETPSGNKYIRMRSNEADDVETIFTIYQGFFVEITQYHNDFSALTEEDVAFANDLLYGLEFEAR